MFRINGIKQNEYAIYTHESKSIFSDLPQIIYYSPVLRSLGVRFLKLTASPKDLTELNNISHLIFHKKWSRFDLIVNAPKTHSTRSNGDLMIFCRCNNRTSACNCIFRNVWRASIGQLQCNLCSDSIDCVVVVAVCENWWENVDMHLVNWQWHVAWIDINNSLASPLWHDTNLSEKYAF